MHKRLTEFILNDQKDFKKISPFTLIENIEKAIDNKLFVCVIFIDVQIAFDTTDHKILLHKIHHYGITDLANDYFSSYLSKRKQFVSLNGFNSTTQSLGYSIPQESVLGPLIFLLYINDLHNVIKFSQTLHFVDDAYLLDIQSKISKNNKSLNKDLKELSFWLNANKIALNVAKTEIILSHFVSSEIFRSVYFAIFQSHINYVFVALGLRS